MLTHPWTDIAWAILLDTHASLQGHGAGAMSAMTRAIEVLTRTPSRDREAMTHAFPADPRYRLSGQAWPQPGDIARCGLVKETTNHNTQGLPLACVVCADLEARA